MDTLISKPARVRGYALHRMVEQLQNGAPALWADEGDRLRVRSADATTPEFEQGQLLGFTLKACVALRQGRRHKYLPLNDWRGRRAWLDQQAVKHGFEIVGVHVKGAMQKIETHDGRGFTVDATEFVGLLKVTEQEAFKRCLTTGVGRVGRAFGLGLLIIN